LHSLNIGFVDRRPFAIDAQLVATGRTCVIGSSGAGKSYTVGVICEELCKNNIPFVLIDIEGEYWGLKEKYEAIWIGEDEKADLRWSEVNLEELAKQALDIAPLILDLSEAEDPKGKVSTFIGALYREISLRRTPYLVVLEEADRFAPQAGKKLQIFDEVARRGRKRGLGLMLCTQRPSLVDKNILSQCANQLIGKLVIQNDLQSVAQFFPDRGLPTQLTELTPGSFYALGGLSSAPLCVRIRQRETKPGGNTPRLMDRVVKPSAEVLEKLRNSPRIEQVPTGQVLTAQQLVQLQHPSPTPAQAQSGLVQLPVQGGQPGLPPLIGREVPASIKRQKSFFLFGEEETVTSVELYYRPLVEVGVRIRSGRIKKKFETKYVWFDRVSGRVVEWSDSLALRNDGLERFLGLSAVQVEGLRAIEPDKDLSVIELAGKSRFPEDMMRKTARFLESKRLVTSIKTGKVKLYRRLVDIPKVPLSDAPLVLQTVNVNPAKEEELKIKEKDIRELLKGYFQGADVDTFKPFFYPLYRVELALKGRRRVVFLDARSSRKVDV
jgi:hypothetical protein